MTQHITWHTPGLKAAAEHLGQNYTQQQCIAWVKGFNKAHPQMHTALEVGTTDTGLFAIKGRSRSGDIITLLHPPLIQAAQIKGANR